MSGDDFDSPYPPIPEGETPPAWLLDALALIRGTNPHNRENQLADFIETTKRVCGRLDHPDAQAAVKDIADPASSEILDYSVSRAAGLILDHMNEQGYIARNMMRRHMAALNRVLYGNKALR